MGERQLKEKGDELKDKLAELDKMKGERDELERRVTRLKDELTIVRADVQTLERQAAETRDNPCRSPTGSFIGMGHAGQTPLSVEGLEVIATGNRRAPHESRCS